MIIGIIGAPQMGKSTIFQLLTNTEIAAASRTSIAIGRIPDNRIDALSQLYKPKKTTYATIEFVDIAGLHAGLSGREFLRAVSDVDALVQVVRSFRSDTVPAFNGTVSPMRDLDQVQAELILTDWGMLETRLERLAKQRAARDQIAAEVRLLEKCRQTLEQDRPLRTLTLLKEEDLLLRGYDFLTRKPLIIVVNVDEGQLEKGEYPDQELLEQWVKEREIPLVAVSGQVEMEISRLDHDDRVLFMEELGIEESGIARLARAVYSHLGLRAFFTVGEDEVRAWTIRAGSTARQAAGKIHSDIERGFIRAEVVTFADLIEYGSIQRLKEKGLFRLEGKDYIVQEGDVISFRFNV